jgi:chemotaxis protein CheX
MKMMKTEPAISDEQEAWIPLLGLSAQEVFSLMLGCRLDPAPAPLSSQGLDITSMVGLAGSMRGLMTLRCASQSAARMALNMLGIESASAGPEVLDAVGEVCNMVAGNFKNKITGMGDGCKLSVPTVITGADYCLRSRGEDSKIEVALLLEGQPILISLEYSRG